MGTNAVQGYREATDGDEERNENDSSSVEESFCTQGRYHNHRRHPEVCDREDHRTRANDDDDEPIYAACKDDGKREDVGAAEEVAARKNDDDDDESRHSKGFMILSFTAIASVDVVEHGPATELLSSIESTPEKKSVRFRDSSSLPSLAERPTMGVLRLLSRTVGCLCCCFTFGVVAYNDVDVGSCCSAVRGDENESKRNEQTSMGVVVNQ